MSDLVRYLEKPEIDNKFLKILGKEKKASFVNNLTTIVSENYKLAKCSETTIVGAALTAANLNLPVSKDLGFAWIIAYGNTAQFQLGYKGLIQLALRTGNYAKLNVMEVFQGQLIKYDNLTESYDFSGKKKDNALVIGFAAFMELKNGFRKVVYWDVDRVKKHGKEFSRSFNRGPWKDNFSAMAQKTVLKHLLSKWGMLSINDSQNKPLHSGIKYDQAIIDDQANVNYADNPKNVQEKDETNAFMEARKQKWELFKKEFKEKIDNCENEDEVNAVAHTCAIFEDKNISDNQFIKGVCERKISELENIEDVEFEEQKEGDNF